MYLGPMREYFNFCLSFLNISIKFYYFCPLFSGMLVRIMPTGIKICSVICISVKTAEITSERGPFIPHLPYYSCFKTIYIPTAMSNYFLF